jgi:hypothetical protein
MVKVSRTDERNDIAELKRGNSLSMLEDVRQGIINGLVDSGESKADAVKYVDCLIAQHID